MPQTSSKQASPHPFAAFFPRSAALVGLAAGAFVVTLGFVLYSRAIYGVGYPLDDAWIHQTYARSLGLHGEWSFLPGQPSAGSTAPLWSALLAVGYLLRLPHFAWTFFLGACALLGLGVLGDALFRALLPGRKIGFPIAGALLVGEWHMAWAAVSGMETLVAAGFIALALVLAFTVRGRGWLLAGAIIGLAVWVRPEGVTLLGPAGLCLLLREPSVRARMRAAGWLAAGVLLLFVPYLLFNLQVQGSLWPNTFYAKQAEYAELRSAPLLLRWWNVLRLPLIGVGIFLLPGFLVFTWHSARRRFAPGMAAVLWFLGYALVYADRLPVSYQYGRYFMPAMPVFFVAGLAGTVLLVPALRRSRAGWFAGRVALLSAGAIWAAFLVIGANRYAQDVAIVETEMVQAARWVAENTPTDALIAAHDIGALGYFGERRLLDLAGLISPEVIPFIRDEERIAGWLDARQADYLVVLADWYIRLPAGKPILYETSGSYSRQSGGGNTHIYRWQPE
jgi:hypothetical protein